MNNILRLVSGRSDEDESEDLASSNVFGVMVVERDNGTRRVAAVLEREHDLRVKRVETAAAVLDRLGDETNVDCVVAPRSALPEQAKQFVHDVRDACPDTPVVLADWGANEFLVERVRRRIEQHRGRSTLVGFRQAVEHAGHAVMITDRNGTIEYVNSAFEGTTGYDAAEAVGRRPSLLKSGIHDGEFYAELWRTILDGEVWEGQLLNRRKSGELYPIEQTIAPIEGDSGRIEKFVAINRDISGRLEQKARLERSRKKYRSLIDVAPDAFVIAEAETGEIVEVNRAATELTGRPRSELVGSDLTTLHPSDECERYRQLFDDHLGSDETVMRELPDGSRIEVVDADGEITPVEINAQTVELTGQTLFQGIFRDVSHWEAHEAELQRQNEQLESFAHTVAHDLRNPLNVIEGQLELARETGETRCIEIAEQATERMKRLVEELLKLAEQGQAVLEPESVALDQVSEEAWRLVSAPEATLEVEADRQLLADENRLCELLENLFSNAVDHAGSTASIRVGSLVDGFYVEDDGPGIPTGQRERVFESGYTTADEGTGFGLAIVSQIATAHDWEVTVTEGTEGGARFEVTGVDQPE